jgi:hypothetical protein
MGHHLGGSRGGNRYARFWGRGFAVETNADHSDIGGIRAVIGGDDIIIIITIIVLDDNPTGGTSSSLRDRRTYRGGRRTAAGAAGTLPLSARR